MRLIRQTTLSKPCHPFKISVTDTTMLDWEFFYREEGVLSNTINKVILEETSLVDCFGEETLIDNPVEAYVAYNKPNGEFLVHLREFTKSDTIKNDFFLKYSLILEMVSTGGTLYTQEMTFTSGWFKDVSCTRDVAVVKPCINIEKSNVDYEGRFLGLYDGTNDFNKVLIDRINCFVYLPQIYLNGGYPYLEGYEYEFTKKANRILKSNQVTKYSFNSEDIGEQYVNEVRNVLGFGRVICKLGNKEMLVNLNEVSITVKDKDWRHKYYTVEANAEDESYRLKGCDNTCYFGGINCRPPKLESFEPVFRTTTANETITLPMSVNAPVLIEWGDGTSTTQSAPFTKVYATPGDYHIKVKTTPALEITNFNFNNAGDKLKLIEIRNWGECRFGTTGGNFQGCSNLASITATDVPKGLTNMFRFFTGCQSLSNINNIGNWDVSNVTNMRDTFDSCVLFNQDISNWATVNVTNMSGMFRNCLNYNKPVTFPTNNVTDMSEMFRNARNAFNQPITFNTSNVTTMRGMFRDALVFNSSVSAMDTSKVTDMSLMFNNARKFNQSVSNFDTGLVTTMSGMFQTAVEFNQPVPFNTVNVINMNSMFNGATVFNQNCNFNTIKVTDMAFMYFNAVAFNSSVSSFNTAEVTTMASMFNNAISFNQSVSNFNTAKVITMESMFSYTPFNQSVSNFNTQNVISFANMFINCGAFNQPVPFNTVKAQFMQFMFSGTGVFNQPILFTVPVLTNMSNMTAGTIISQTNMDNMWIHIANQLPNLQSNVNVSLQAARSSASNTAVNSINTQKSWGIA